MPTLRAGSAPAPRVALVNRARRGDQPSDQAAARSWTGAQMNGTSKAPVGRSASRPADGTADLLERMLRAVVCDVYATPVDLPTCPGIGLLLAAAAAAVAGEAFGSQSDHSR